MSRLLPPGPFRRAQELVRTAIERVDEALDRAAETIVRDYVGLEVVVDEPIVPPAPSSAAAGRSEYDDMISDYTLQLGYHRDKNWSVPEMWLEMTAGGIGAGTFLASALTGCVPGMAVGYGLTVAVKGTLLLLDLGRPERVWRVFSKPRTSWIARGSWAFAAFAVTGGLATLGGLMGTLGSAAVLPLTALAVTSSLVLLTYDGFFLNASAGVAGWRASALPYLFAANAAATGAALTAALLANPPLTLLGAAAGGFLLAGGLGAAYLSEVSGGVKSARVSAHELRYGKQSVDFLTAGGLVGTVIPTGLAALAATGVLRGPLAALAAALGAVGVLYSRKAVLEAGVHAPVM